MAKVLGITYIWHGMPDWDAVVAARPDVVVMNPDSGPGNLKVPGVAANVAQCRAAGIKVLGYVALNYGDKDRSVVLEEASKYRQWYGVDGFFWDEAPTNPLTYQTKLRGVHGYARGVDKTGISVFNPGVMPGQLSTLMVLMPGSIWVTFEGPEWLYQTHRPNPVLYKSRQAHIVYGVSSQFTKSQLDSSGVGWGFVTSDDLPNPFDTWPSRWYN